MKKKVIKLETIAKTFSNPQRFMDDLSDLIVKFRVFEMKYGELGLKTFLKSLEDL